MSTILALDVATRTGAAVGEPGTNPKIFCVDFRAGGDVFTNCVRWATRVFTERPPELVVLEDLVPKYDKTVQCGLHSIISGIAGANGVPVEGAPIQTWRALVLGNGKLSRQHAKTRAIQVCAQLGWPVKNDDEAEAACIWLYACSLKAPRLAQRIPFFMRGAA